VVAPRAMDTVRARLPGPGRETVRLTYSESRSGFRFASGLPQLDQSITFLYKSDVVFWYKFVP